jgi:hypothetical protein
MPGSIRDSVRLTFRMHRFELVATLVFAGALIVGAYWVAGRLDAVGYGPCALAQSPPPSCEALGRQFYDIQESQATPIFGFLAILPYVAGLFLGGPIIAREIERGTTRLAWSIAPSRLRWYVSRVAPIVVVLVVVTFAAGMAADRLVAARSPGIDLANSFDSYGERGVLVAVTALVMATGALGLGAVIGRVLPTIILALVLGYFGILAVGDAHERFTRSEAVMVDEADVGRGDRYVDQFFRLPDGSLIGWEEMYELDPAAMESETGQTKYPIVSFVIPGERYRVVEAREAIALGGIALVMLIGTGVVVQRRRPG